MALGAHYREESIDQHVWASQGNTAADATYFPVWCPDNVVTTNSRCISQVSRGIRPPGAIGVRGVPGNPYQNTVETQFSNVPFISGSFDVKELYTELLFPLIADQPWMRSLNFQGAVRWADYAGSGDIWSYKVGLDAAITDEVRLRGTYSHDTRAANIAERFDRTGGFTGPINDPTAPPGWIQGTLVTTVSGGNPLVDPEEADTFTAGIVYQPQWLPGLDMSVDWVSVSLEGAIEQLLGAARRRPVLPGRRHGAVREDHPRSDHAAHPVHPAAVREPVRGEGGSHRRRDRLHACRLHLRRQRTAGRARHGHLPAGELDHQRAGRQGGFHRQRHPPVHGDTHQRERELHERPVPLEPAGALPWRRHAQHRLQPGAAAQRQHRRDGRGLGRRGQRHRQLGVLGYPPRLRDPARQRIARAVTGTSTTCSTGIRRWCSARASPGRPEAATTSWVASSRWASTCGSSRQGSPRAGTGHACAPRAGATWPGFFFPGATSAWTCSR